MSEEEYVEFFRSLRRNMEDAKSVSPDLNAWWYSMHSLLPRLRVAESLAVSAQHGKDAKKLRRFLDEAFTDFMASLGVAVRGILAGERTPMSNVFLDRRSLSEIGVVLKDLRTGEEVRVKQAEANPDLERTIKHLQGSEMGRHFLPRFWYHAAVEQMKTENRAYRHGDAVPEILDKFNPFLALALYTLRKGRLYG